MVVKADRAHPSKAWRARLIGIEGPGYMWSTTDAIRGMGRVYIREGKHGPGRGAGGRVTQLSGSVIVLGTRVCAYVESSTNEVNPDTKPTTRLWRRSVSNYYTVGEEWDGGKRCST